jgi:hypothetical protein
MCMSLLDAYVPDLKDRYNYLEDEFFEHLRVFDVKNMNDCVIYMQVCIDVYLLIKFNFSFVFRNSETFIY